MSARLRAADTEIESLEDGFTLTTSKLRDLVQALTGFDIQETEDSYKDIYEILRGIGKEWENLTDLEQASLSEELFGKRNSQVGFAVLQNVERLEELYDLAKNSAGSAMEEQEKYLEGVTYQIDRFKASVEELANDFMSADFLKGVIKSGATFINILDDIIDKLGTIPLLFTTISGVFSLKGWGINQDFVKNLFGANDVKANFKDILMPIDNNDITKLQAFDDVMKQTGGDFETAFGNMEGASQIAQDFAKSFKGVELGSRIVTEEFKAMNDANRELNISQLASSRSLNDINSVLKIYNNELDSVNMNETEFTNIVAKSNSVLGNYLASVKVGEATFGGYISALVKAKIATIAFKAAAMAMQMVLTMVVTFIVSKVISAIDDFIHASDKAIERAENAKQAIDEINSALKTQQKTVEDSSKRFAELSQGVDDLTGKNVSLSDEDYKEFLDISNQLAEVFPTLTYHYDENGNKIVKLSGSVSDITKSLEDLLKVEQDLARQKILDNMGDVFDGAKAKADSYNKELVSLHSNVKSIKDDYSKAQQQLESQGIFGIRQDQIKEVDKWLDSLGVKYTRWLDNTTPTYTIANYDILPDNVKNQILAFYEQDISDIEAQIDKINQEKSKSMSTSLSEGISAWLFSDFTFVNFNSEMQSAIQQMINQLDISNLDLEEQSWEGLQKWITDNILNVIKDNPELEDAIDIGFNITSSFNNDKVPFAEYEKKLKEILPLIMAIENAESRKAILLALGIEIDDNGNIVDTTVNNVIGQFEKAGIDKKLSEQLAKSLSKAELEAIENNDFDWSKLLKQDSFLNQLNYIRKTIKELGNTPFSINLNVSNIESTAKGVKELQSAYQKLYDKMQEGKTGSDLAFSYEDLNSLKSSLVDVEGNVVDLGDSWNEFFDIMSDGSHSFEEMESALNQLLTTYVNSTVDLQNFDKSQADALSTQLQLAGVTKESADAYVEAMTNQANAVQEAVDAGYKMSSITAEEIDDLAALKGWSEETAQAVAAYALKKQIANGLVINTEADIRNLNNLAEAAGITARYLNLIIEARQKLASDQAKIESGLYEGAELTALLNDANLQRTRINNLTEMEEASLKKQLNSLATNQAKALKYDTNKVKSAKSSAGKETDAWKEAYEKELAELDHIHELELISDIEYYEEREKLNDKYFKDREKYTEEYNKNLEDIYKGFQQAYKQYVDDMSDYWKKSLDAGLISFQQYCKNMKSMLDDLHDAGKITDEVYYNSLADYYGTLVENMDKVVNAVQRRLKKEIDGLNKQKDALKDIYDARKKVVQDQIDSIQKEIDNLEEANKKRQEALDLQKALYNLNRAENQRPNLVYNSEKGYIYMNAEADIKEAQEEIEDIRYQQKVSALEASITSLEEQIDLLDNELDSLTKNLENQIDKLQEYSDRWGEVANKYREAQEDMIASAVLGSNWQNDILALNETTLNNFTNDYYGYMQAQADATLQAANSVVSQYHRMIDALNEWKRAQAEAAQTGYSTNANEGKTPITPSSPSGTRGGSSNLTNPAKQYTPSYNTGTAAIKKQFTLSTRNKSNPRQMAYGRGTKNAKLGWHEIAESGNEIVLDNYGNAFLAEGYQLHKFEGGERVYSSDETKELLSGKYIPVDSILPNYSDMLSKIINSGFNTSVNNSNNVLATKSNIKKNTESGKTINITVGDVHVTEVDNATQIAKAITNELPNALLQELNKR